MKIALVQLNPIIGALEYNACKIIQALDEMERKGVDLIVFPEMALCGYPPEDLLLIPSFVDSVEETLKKVIQACKKTAIIGCIRKNPFKGEKGLHNSAAIIQNRELIGFQDKTLLPDYDVFSERRYFEPASANLLWSLFGKKIAVTICEDIWQHAGAVEYSLYPKDPVRELQTQSPDLLINISASPYYYKRLDTRLHVCRKAAETLKCPIFFCNQVGGNDSLIFDGYSFAIDRDRIFQANGFEEDILITGEDSHSFLSSSPIEDLFKALTLGVRDYFYKQGFSKACLGLSGGIDSAVVAVIAKEALGAENVVAFALPSRFSSEMSTQDAKKLAQQLNISFEVISIDSSFEHFLHLLHPYFKTLPSNIAEENLQARIRGIILMAFSNKFGYIVLGTGNKSEMAMGYATLYGDMCGGLGVLNDVTKKQIYLLAEWINRNGEVIPRSIIERAPSAELKPNQKDTDTLPEYSVIDKVLEEYIEKHLSPEEIAFQNNLPLPLVKKLVRKIHLAEYKRRQAPPGLRVTKRAFTVGRRFPIVQGWNLDDAG